MIYGVFQWSKTLFTEKNTVNPPQSVLKDGTRNQSKIPKNAKVISDSQNSFYSEGQGTDVAQFNYSSASGASNQTKTVNSKGMNQSKESLGKNVINGFIWSEILSTPRSKQKIIRK